MHYFHAKCAEYCIAYKSNSGVCYRNGRRPLQSCLSVFRKLFNRYQNITRYTSRSYNQYCYHTPTLKFLLGSESRRRCCLFTGKGSVDDGNSIR